MNHFKIIFSGTLLLMVCLVFSQCKKEKSGKVTDDDIEDIVLNDDKGTKEKTDKADQAGVEKTAYTTGDILNARKEPKLKAARVTMIPYGTKLTVKQTKHKMKYGKTENFWYEVPAISAFVYGSYLVDKEAEKKKKSMRLKRKVETGVDTMVTNLVLYNNTASFSAKGDGPEGEINQSTSGTYDLKDDKIIVDLKKSKSHKGEKLELVFVKKAKGFLTAKQYSAYKKNKFTIDSKECMLTDKATDEVQGYYCP